MFLFLEKWTKGNFVQVFIEKMKKEKRTGLKMDCK